MKTIVKKLQFSMLAILMALASCSKDDNNNIDNSCGTVLTIEKESRLNDGGFVEYGKASACGEAFQGLKRQAELTGLTIFYKGQTRTKVKYIVAKHGSDLTLYIRYESNNIPQTSIDHWTTEGYEVTIQELTGLEGANY